MADLFGEIFIDWQVRHTVSISFADEHIQLLSVLHFLKLDRLVKETIQSFRLSASLPLPNLFSEALLEDQG